MSDSPSDKPNNVLPLLRIGLEEGDPATVDPDVTVRVPKPATGTRPRTGSARMWQPPSVEELQRLLPQYEVQAFIARGGMGAVYRGVQRSLGRTVAIKILPPDADDDDEVNFAERFKREARAMASLSHPGIVAVHDAGEVQGSPLAPREEHSAPLASERPSGAGDVRAGESAKLISQERDGYRTTPRLLYFVMEYIEGTDVAQLIASEGRVEPQRALAITAHVCDALAFAHESGIVHRDIKPSNIMLDKRGRVKVADFGLAKTTTQESRGLTLSGMAMGTPDFVAPETLVAGTKVDQRADIYAVGVMLYQMLTGEIPRGRFELPSQMLPQLDARLDAVIDRAMQRDRDKRYSSALDLRADLDAITTTPMAMPSTINVGAKERLDSDAPSGPQKSDSAGDSPTTRRRALIALPIAVALAVIAFLVFKQPGQDGPTRSGGIPAAAGTASTVPPGYAWQRVFQEKVKDGWILLNDETLRAPAITDGAVRLELAGNDDNCTIILRENTQLGSYVASHTSKQVAMRMRQPGGAGKDAELSEHPLPPRNSSGTDRFEFRAFGTTLTVLWNGVVAGTVEHDAIKVGGIGIYGRNARVRNIEVLRPDAAGGAAAPKPPSGGGALGQSALPSTAAELWLDLLRDPAKTKTTGNVELTGEGVRFRDAGWVSFNHPLRPLRDGAIRVRATFGGARPQVQVRRTPDGSAYGINAKDERAIVLQLWNQEARQTKILREFPLRQPLQAGKDYELELRATGQNLTAKCNGELLGTVTDKTFTEGEFGVGIGGPISTPLTILSLKFLNLETASGATSGPSTTSRYPAGQWVRPYQKAADIHQKWFDAGAKWEEGWITPGADNNQSIALGAPNAQGHNWGARARIRCGGGFAGIVLRRNGTATSNTVSNYEFRVTVKGGAEFVRGQGRGSVSGSDRKPMGDPFPIPLTEGQEVLIEAFAIGDTLYGRVEGKVFTMKTDGVLKEGGLEVATQIMPCRDIEFINLDGLSEAEAKKAAGLE